MKNISFILINTVFFISLFTVVNAATQKPGLNYQNVAGEAGYETFKDKGATDKALGAYIGFYVSIALSFVASLLLIYMLYAGFLWTTAGGNEDQIGNAKSILKNCVIGLVIIASAYIITTTILSVSQAV